MERGECSAVFSLRCVRLATQGLRRRHGALEIVRWRLIGSLSYLDTVDQDEPNPAAAKGFLRG